MKTILVFISAYLPGYKAGGPLRSISNLVEHLGDEYCFRIVTADRDRGGTSPYRGLDDGCWHEVGKAQVRYLRPEEQSLLSIARLMRETPHDALYLNSFFTPTFTTCPLLAMRFGLASRMPVFLAPRGEFSKGALSIRLLKKRAFISGSRIVGLHNKVVWQATTEFEAADVIREMGERVRKRLHIAQNLPRAIGEQPRPKGRSPATPLRLTFLSRIVPKKNLLFALEVLCEVRAPVRFTIMGPKEDKGYWRACEAAIKKLPPNIEVVETGPVPAEDVAKKLAEQDLFFFPTLGENYGHVIAEALQAGLPVLISNQTPWRNLISKRVGADFPLNQKQDFVDFIHATAGLSEAQWNKLRLECWYYAKRRNNQEAIVASYREMFGALDSMKM